MRQDGPSPLKVAGHTIHRDVLSSIQAASKQTGVSFAYLMAQAGKESAFKAVAQNGSSSAAGLYQFTKSTWLQLIKETGAKYGYGDIAAKISRGPKGEYVITDPEFRQTIYDLRRDPELSSLMAAEYAMNNKARMERALKRPVSYTDLHLAHFLGPGGAVKLLRAREADAQTVAADIVPNAARQNPSIFYSKPDQTPRSVAGVYQKVHDSIDRPMRNYAGLENHDPASPVIAVAYSAAAEDQPKPRKADRKAAQMAKAEIRNEVKAERAAESMGDKLMRIAGQLAPGKPVQTALAEALIPSAKAAPAPVQPVQIAKLDKPAARAVPPSGFGPEQAAGHLAEKLNRLAGQAVPDAAVQLAQAITAPAPGIAIAQAEPLKPVTPEQARQAAAGLAGKAGRLAGKALPDKAVLLAATEPKQPEPTTTLAQAEPPKPVAPEQVRQTAAGLAGKAGRLAGKALPDKAVLLAATEPKQPAVPAQNVPEEAPIILAKASAAPPPAAGVVAAQLQRIASRVAADGAILAAQAERTARDAAAPSHRPTLAMELADAETIADAALPEKTAPPETQAAIAPPEFKPSAAPPALAALQAADAASAPDASPSLEEQFANLDGQPLPSPEERVIVALRDDAESYDQVSLPMPPRPANSETPTFSPDPNDREGTLSKLFQNVRRTLLG